MKGVFTIEPFQFIETELGGSFVIEPIVKKDDRGWFYRFFDQQIFKDAGLNASWLQMNHSYTKHKGTIRGMHFQYPPFIEVKMVRCIAGAVRDIIIDLRYGSPTFLKSTAVELSALNRKALYIPEGFAHGFQTLEANSELLYQHSATYQPGAEGGLRYNDPRLNMQWSLPVSLVSERDIAHPLIGDDFTGLNIYK